MATKEQKLAKREYDKEYRAKNSDKIKERRRRYYQANKEKSAATTKAYAAQHVEECRAYQKAYREDNREQLKTYFRERRLKNLDGTRAKDNQYRADNLEKVKALQRCEYLRNIEAHKIRNKDYRENNPGKMNWYQTKRRLRVLQQRPAWADLDAIGAIYAEARKLTEETGVQYHVDHVIPLKGKTISGLHCEANLQILTATENLRKGASFDGSRNTP